MRVALFLFELFWRRKSILLEESQERLLECDIPKEVKEESAWGEAFPPSSHVRGTQLISSQSVFLSIL